MLIAHAVAGMVGAMYVVRALYGHMPRIIMGLMYWTGMSPTGAMSLPLCLPVRPASLLAHRAEAPDSIITAQMSLSLPSQSRHVFKACVASPTLLHDHRVVRSSPRITGYYRAPCSGNHRGQTIFADWGSANASAIRHLHSKDGPRHISCKNVPQCLVRIQLE